ncbi:myc-associated zinc finger protein-like [Frankliniella occidentalis]|uniref:Myc-associated zinc finger protein-like n=1 Tax=Frankliniella occidentalis TaxID=133901 RepID=A0A6J1TDL3_FRAOC|nr:myc-associated zinc finger protein-like [Frankliniella occidentalis]
MKPLWELEEAGGRTSLRGHFVYYTNPMSLNYMDENDPLEDDEDYEDVDAWSPAPSSSAAASPTPPAVDPLMTPVVSRAASPSASAPRRSPRKGAAAVQVKTEPGPSRLPGRHACCVPGAPCDAHSDAVANVIAQFLPQPTRPPRNGHGVARARRLGTIAKKAKPSKATKFRRQKQPLAPADSEGEAAKSNKKSFNNRPQPLVLHEDDTSRRFRCRRCKGLVEGGDRALLDHWRRKHLAVGARLDPSQITAHELNEQLAQNVLDLPRKTLMKTYRGPGGYRCPVCSKVITMVQRLRTHVYCHMENPPENFVCKVCPTRTTFYEYSGMWRHYLQWHKNAKPYACEFCDQSFKLPSLLNDHVRKYHKDKVILKGTSYIKK